MKKMLRTLSMMLVLVICLSMLSACGGTKIPEEAKIVFETEETEGTYYFYGVEQSGGMYYAKVLETPKEAPQEADFLYAPLDFKLNASFQLDGWVGGWSPVAYSGANELQAACEDGKITLGTKCVYQAQYGRIKNLEEANDYLNNDVTGN